MRKSILIALMMISTGVFAADEGKNQTNVYDDFRGFMKPSADVTVDEQVTAIIKRDMANLLYPVDMSSLSRPNNDTKFRDLIMVLQQQMGDSPTGILTIDQFDRLEKASRNIDGDLIGVPPERQVFMSEDGRWASASGVMDGTAEGLSSVRIFCDRARGICERYVATFDLETRFLFLDVGTEYQIITWTPSGVTAVTDAPCSTSLMTLDVKDNQVTAVTAPKPNCTGFTQIVPWHLVDGLPVAQKLSQDRMNQARAVVYPPAKQLMPVQK